MKLWERLTRTAMSRRPSLLPKLANDLWGRTLNAHTRLDEQTIRVEQLEAVVHGLTDEVDRLRLQVEVLQAHETGRKDG